MVIKFLTYNIWYSKNWRKIISFIKKQIPDIFTLQEVTSNFPEFNLNNTDVVAEFRKAFPKYQSVFAPILYKEEGGKVIQFGNMILSRFPITNHKAHYFFKQPDWNVDDYENQARHLLEAQIDVKGKRIFVFTTHLTYSKSFQDNPKKIEEAKKIVEIIKDKKPTILAGDFNSTPDSEVIRIIDAQIKYIDREKHPTWTKHPFSKDGFEANTLDWKLDYIFLSKDLSHQNLQIIDTDLSDHLPIKIEIILP